MPRRPGELHRLQHRLDEALEGFAQTLTACGAPGDYADRALATGRIRTVHDDSGHKTGRFDEALSRLEAALSYLRELADRHSEVSAMRTLGTVHRLQRCHEKAARCFQQVLDALDVFSDPVRNVALVSSGAASGVRLAALHGTPYAGW